MKNILNKIEIELHNYKLCSQNQKEEILNRSNIELEDYKNKELKTSMDLKGYFETSIKNFLLTNNLNLKKSNDNEFEENNEELKEYKNINLLTDFYNKCNNDFGERREYEINYYFLNYVFLSQVTKQYYYPIDSSKIIENFYKDKNKYKEKIKNLNKEKTTNEIDYLVNEYKKTKIYYLKNNSGEISLPEELKLEKSKEISEIVFSIYEKSKFLFMYMKGRKLPEEKNLTEYDKGLIEENYGLSTFLMYKIYKNLFATNKGFYDEKNKYIISLKKRLIHYIDDLIMLNESFYKCCSYETLMDNTFFIEDEIFLYYTINKKEKTIKIIKNSIKFINFLLLNETNKSKIIRLEEQKEDYLILLKIIFSPYTKE